MKHKKQTTKSMRNGRNVVFSPCCSLSLYIRQNIRKMRYFPLEKEPNGSSSGSLGNYEEKEKLTVL